MKILVKNNATGQKREFEFPDNLPAKEVSRIKEYLAGGGLAKRDFSISTRNAKKAYIPDDADVQMIASAIGEEAAWVSENFYFVKMLASDTTVDLQWDKFSESVIRSLGVQYAEGWDMGEQGGRTQCIMHDRDKIVGRTYKYEVQDAVGADGVALIDENGTTIKQLIVYAYVNKSAQYKGEPFVNFIRDGRFAKVSISAWIYGWEYIPSERSNWIPPGETQPSGYFYYPDGSSVEAIELSFVDMGANSNAQIMKSKIADVTVMEEPAATTENTVEVIPVTETTAETETNGKETEKTTSETEKVSDISLNINIADYGVMKAFWEDLPEYLRKGAAIKWEEVTLKNHGDGKAFYAPDYCATRFKNIDRTLGTQKQRIDELEARVSELESAASLNSEKSISLELDVTELTKGSAELESKLAIANESLAKANAIINTERRIYTDKFVTYSAEVDGTAHDREAIEALNLVASTMTLDELRTKSAALQVISVKNKERNTLKNLEKERPKKGF